MKILFVCQYFYPEVFRGNDIAFHWAEQGHEVQVVSGIPNYPEGKFHEGYGLFKKRHETVNGVKVTRLPIFPRGNSKIMLILNYFSYLVVAWGWMLFHAMFHKYDRVFVQQLSPVMMSAPGVLYKRLKGVPLYTWVLDLWPDVLSVVGGIHHQWSLSLFRYFAKQQYKHSDKILVSSRSFEKSIIEYGNYVDKVVYFPQWSDLTLSSLCVHEFNGLSLPVLPDGFKLMFAGAVGEAQDFECMMQAALLTKEYDDIKWIIIGDGRKHEWVSAFVEEHGLNESVYTLGHYPPEMMRCFFSQANVMLVTLGNDPLFSLYAPAKISSYMAAGKPIVAVMNGEGAEVIRDADCGWTLSAGDVEGFARLAVELSKMDKAVLAEKGRNATAYYEQHFVKEKCLRKLDELMEINLV